MKHEMTMFIADRKLNDFMACFDMRPDSKWFIAPTVVSFSTTTVVDEAYFMGIIEKSRALEDRWIPAISYMGNLFVAPEVRILSDGEKEMFIPFPSKEKS